MLSGNAGEAEIIHSEDEPVSEGFVGSEPVKNVLTDSDAEAAYLGVAIAIALKIFILSHPALPHSTTVPSLK
jgi:hypothetical protein